jgi:hypothetical protein
MPDTGTFEVSLTYWSVKYWLYQPVFHNELSFF